MSECLRGHDNGRFTDGRCIECAKLARRAERLADPAKYRRLKSVSDLRVKYGLTVQEYQQMFVKQRGSCAICECSLVSRLDDGRSSGRGPDRAIGNVDHCHLTNVVRGLLCSMLIRLEPNDATS